MPKVLTDGGSDSLLKTVYDSSDFIFDPDSRIKSLTIEINSSSSNNEVINLSKQQDKLSLDNNSTNTVFILMSTEFICHILCRH